MHVIAPDLLTTSQWSPDEAPTADAGSGTHSYWPSRQHRGTIGASDCLMWSGHYTVLSNHTTTWLHFKLNVCLGFVLLLEVTSIRPTPLTSQYRMATTRVRPWRGRRWKRWRSRTITIPTDIAGPSSQMQMATNSRVNGENSSLSYYYQKRNYSLIWIHVNAGPIRIRYTCTFILPSLTHYMHIDHVCSHSIIG